MGLSKVQKQKTTESRVFVLHAANLGLILGTIYGPLNLPGVIPETESGISYEQCWMWLNDHLHKILYKTIYLWFAL